MVGQRRYQGGCPVALGMDLVGERWALLIVRELLLGPKRFGDLRAGLLGSSADMITVRLRELETHGIVQRRRLPAPASAWVYELTPWGAELEPIVVSLARWSIRSAEMATRANEPLSVDSAVLSLRVLFKPGAAAGAALTLAIVVDGQPFRVTVHDGVLDVGRGEAPDADLRLVTDPGTLAALARGDYTLDAERPAGHVELTGDATTASTFFGFFGTTAQERRPDVRRFREVRLRSAPGCASGSRPWEGEHCEYSATGRGSRGGTAGEPVVGLAALGRGRCSRSGAAGGCRTVR